MIKLLLSSPIYDYVDIILISNFYFKQIRAIDILYLKTNFVMQNN